MYASVQPLDVEAATPAAEKQSSRRRRGVLVSDHCDGQIAVEKFPDEARWYTLWTRSEAPLASFPFRAKNLGPEAWQEFRTTTDGKWFSQDRT